MPIVEQARTEKEQRCLAEAVYFEKRAANRKKARRPSRKSC